MLIEIAIGHDVLILEKRTYVIMEVQIYWLSLTTSLLFFSMKRERDVN